MIEVPAAITISGILACVASGAAASAAGVTPKPAMILTLSLTISSWARRLVLSGSVASSLRMTSIFLPATVSPCCCMYSLIALSICLPVEAWPPVIGRIRPIFTVSCAFAGAKASSTRPCQSRQWVGPGRGAAPTGPMGRYRAVAATTRSVLIGRILVSLYLRRQPWLAACKSSYVPCRAICTNVQINCSCQQQRIRRKPGPRIAEEWPVAAAVSEFRETSLTISGIRDELSQAHAG
jgi:hypothetical protein